MSRIKMLIVVDWIVNDSDPKFSAISNGYGQHLSARRASYCIRGRRESAPVDGQTFIELLNGACRPQDSVPLNVLVGNVPIEKVGVRES